MDSVTINQLRRGEASLNVKRVYKECEGEKRRCVCGSDSENSQKRNFNNLIRRSIGIIRPSEPRRRSEGR